jgi:hypothetical protein
MARPPTEIAPSLTPEAALEHLRRWRGLAPIASWAVSDAWMSAALGEPETLHLLLIARDITSLAVPVEVEEAFAFSPDDQRLQDEDEHAARLRARVEHLIALAAGASADEAVQAYVGAHEGVIARLDLLGGEERLVFRAPTEAGGDPPMFYPPLTRP